MPPRSPRPEIEITPDMIDAMEHAYCEWWAANERDHDVGLPGDVVALFASLKAACANVAKS